MRCTATGDARSIRRRRPGVPSARDPRPPAHCPSCRGLPRRIEARQRGDLAAIAPLAVAASAALLQGILGPARADGAVAGVGGADGGRRGQSRSGSASSIGRHRAVVAASGHGGRPLRPDRRPAAPRNPSAESTEPAGAERSSAGTASMQDEARSRARRNGALGAAAPSRESRARQSNSERQGLAAPAAQAQDSPAPARRHTEEPTRTGMRLTLSPGNPARVPRRRQARPLRRAPTGARNAREGGDRPRPAGSPHTNRGRRPQRPQHTPPVKRRAPPRRQGGPPDRRSAEPETAMNLRACGRSALTTPTKRPLKTRKKADPSPRRTRRRRHDENHC